MSELHTDALATLEGWVPPTPRDNALRERFIAHLRARPDAMTRDCFPDHLTAGALVITPEADAVLLNHHRKAGAWLAFGGHAEAQDTSLASVARREMVEESGLIDVVLDPVPLNLDEHAVEFCDRRGTVHHLDVRFVATASRDGAPEVSEESLDVRWWPVDALPQTFDDMYRLIDAAVARVRQSASSYPSGSSSRAADDQPAR